MDAYADAGLHMPSTVTVCISPCAPPSCAMPLMISTPLQMFPWPLQAFPYRRFGRTSTTWRPGETSHGLTIATLWTSFRHA